MKIPRIILMGLLPLAFVFGTEGLSDAFHNGGVGPCEGCHTMHNSSGGSFVKGPYSNAYLLMNQDDSSTCLNCHEQPGDLGPTTYHVSTPYSEVQQGMPPKQLTPGGDFGWLHMDFSTSVSSITSPGERHGHNIVAADFSYFPDSTYTVAPGGTYPSNRLGCTSCHDPHGIYRRNVDGTITTTGKPIAGSGSFASSPHPDNTVSVGVYRMLGGQGYQPKSLIGGLAFMNGPPAAVAPDKPNRSEAVMQTRVAYGTGMSEWCRNCHTFMHTAQYPGAANLIHASGAAAKLGLFDRMNNYNKYVTTGNLTGLSQTAYLSLVPFEEGSADYAVLQAHAKTDNTWLNGADGNSQVMCLTCHRAHASGWDGAMRWDSTTAYIVYNGYYAQSPQSSSGRTEAEATKAYYDRPASTFATNQDSLCNKCHIGVYP
jgi:hypothetical protein